VRRIAIIALVAYALLLHAALVLAVLRPERVRAMLRLDDPSQPSEFWLTMVATQQRIDAQAAGSVVIIGDSLVQGMNVNRLMPDVVNYGIAGDTIGGIAQRVQSYPSLPQARAIIIAAGINELAEHDADEAAAAYGRLMALLPEDVPIIASAVLRVDEAHLRFPNRFRSNDQIRRLNAAIAQLCAARAGCSFVDAGAALVDASGNLRREFHEGDGLHLSAAGYGPWVAALRAALIARGLTPSSGPATPGAR
jgi:lysophospholipase L1-like esterase